MKVVVINPPVATGADFIDHPYFANLGALQHASLLAAEGYDVSIADSFAQPDSDVSELDGGGYIAGCSTESLIDILNGWKFDIALVCVSVYHKPYMRDEHIAVFFARLRAAFPKVTISAADAYFGGVHYIDYKGEVFLRDYPEVDVLFRYESEAVLLDWLKDSGGRPAGMRKEIIGDPPGNLDRLPLPNWSLIDTRAYLEFVARFMERTGRVPGFSEIMPVLPLVTSRGCLYCCAFCCGTAIPQRGKLRRISPGRLGAHLRKMKKQYGIQGVVIMDGLANSNVEDFTELLKSVKAAGLNVHFPNGLRADRLRKKHVAMLAEISPSIKVSAESASNNVRNGLLNKKLKLSAIEKVAEWCREYDLSLGIHYMIGVPGETVTEMNATLEHAHYVAEEFDAEPLVQHCVPLPGSLLYERMRSAGQAVPDVTREFVEFFKEGAQVEPERETAEADHGKASRMLRYFRKRMTESTPEKLIINLTYRCNNKCMMCAVKGKPRRHMEFERCAELLSEYYTMGVTMVDFDGGEPTIHPQLLEIIGLAENTGYDRINITTNGRRLSSRDFASRLLLSGITDIHISVYGPDAATHDKVTGVKGSFNETAEGIRNVVRLRPDCVEFYVNTVITADNYKKIESMTGWLAGVGVNSLNVQFPTPFGSAKGKHLPPMKEAMKAVNRAAAKYGDVVKMNLVNLPPCMMPEGWPAAIDAEKYGRHMAFVDAPPQSLGAYLSSRRKRTDECRDCEYFIVCEGLYEFD